MSGFPGRSSRTAYGPTYENERPVRNSKREVGQNIFNLLFWDLAGCTKTVPKAVIRCSVSGGAVSNDYQSLAFDQDSALSGITFTYVAAGRYSFALASQYVDVNGTLQSTSLAGGVASLDGQVAASGTHTGSNNAAVLTDSTQSWTTNEFIGYQIYNTTDGSKATITANTATTVTGTLAGGTDNDYDTSDKYIIVPIADSAHVSLSSGNEGEVLIFDESRNLVDPDGFMLVLW